MMDMGQHCPRQRLLKLMKRLFAFIVIVILIAIALDTLSSSLVRISLKYSQDRVRVAEAKAEELESVLNGKVVMVETLGKEYAQYAKVTWHLAENKER